MLVMFLRLIWVRPLERRLDELEARVLDLGADIYRRRRQ